MRLPVVYNCNILARNLSQKKTLIVIFAKFKTSNFHYSREDLIVSICLWRKALGVTRREEEDYEEELLARLITTQIMLNC